MTRSIKITSRNSSRFIDSLKSTGDSARLVPRIYALPHIFRSCCSPLTSVYFSFNASSRREERKKNEACGDFKVTRHYHMCMCPVHRTGWCGRLEGRYDNNTLAILRFIDTNCIVIIRNVIIRGRLDNLVSALYIPRNENFTYDGFRFFAWSVSFFYRTWSYF